MFDYGKIVFFMAYLGFYKPGIGTLQLAIQMVQNRHASSRTATRQVKGIYNFTWQFPLFVLSQGDFCFPAWRFCTT